MCLFFIQKSYGNGSIVFFKITYDDGLLVFEHQFPARKYCVDVKIIVKDYHVGVFTFFKATLPIAYPQSCRSV